MLSHHACLVALDDPAVVELVGSGSDVVVSPSPDAQIHTPVRLYDK